MLFLGCFRFFKGRRWILSKTHPRTQARKHTPHLYSAAKQSKVERKRCHRTVTTPPNVPQVVGGEEAPCSRVCTAKKQHFHHAATIISRKESECQTASE